MWSVQVKPYIILSSIFGQTVTQRRPSVDRRRYRSQLIQGSGLGPAAYVVTAADLHPCTTGNCIFKYADDTYLLVHTPTANSSTRRREIEHIGDWAVQNNLTLNCGKTKEMVITARGKRGKLANPPAPCLDIEQVSSMRILGVTVNEQTLVCRWSCQQFTGVE